MYNWLTDYTMKNYDLGERTIKFSIDVILLTKTFSIDDIGQILSRQLIKSASSVALNYGEAKGGESRRDFVHKLKISLKELHETKACLRIVDGIDINRDSQKGRSQ